MVPRLIYILENFIAIKAIYSAILGVPYIIKLFNITFSRAGLIIETGVIDIIIIDNIIISTPAARIVNPLIRFFFYKVIFPVIR